MQTILEKASKCLGKKKKKKVGITVRLNGHERTGLTSFYPPSASMNSHVQCGCHFQHRFCGSNLLASM